MGTTHLVVESDPDRNYVVVHFIGRNGGALGWQHRLDEFKEALYIEGELLPTVEFLDRDQMLGRGARVRLAVRALAYVIHAWAENRQVELALDQDSLHIDSTAMTATAWAE